jgi:hypothetical protein
VYHCIANPENYFRQLRPSLKEKTGRLYIIHFKDISNFSEVEFGDFTKIIRIFISKGQDFPVFMRLRKENQTFSN